MITKIVQICYDKANIANSNTGLRSIFDNHISTVLGPLQALCNADKRLAKEVSTFVGFGLDNKFARVGLPPPPGWNNPMMRNSVILENNGIAGVALEHRTLLGKEGII